jgi:hypothetical protein
LSETASDRAFRGVEREVLAEDLERADVDAPGVIVGGGQRIGGCCGPRRRT